MNREPTSYRFTDSTSLALDAAVEALSKLGYERPLRSLLEMWLGYAYRIAGGEIEQYEGDPFHHLHGSIRELVAKEGILSVLKQREATIAFRPDPEGPAIIVTMYLVQRQSVDEDPYRRWWEVVYLEVRDPLKTPQPRIEPEWNMSRSATSRTFGHLEI